ncbi:MAG: Gfo/Idh/MocA family oxidoreductase [Verrucomicrobiia bacterium]|jgi:predicted dehydrogenase
MKAAASHVPKLAVIGTGALGKEHARICAELSKSGEALFSGVYDINKAVAEKIAANYGVKVFDSIADAISECDAANIVTPTITHYEIAAQFLKNKRHVFVEKPMTDNIANAIEMVRLARENGCVLQVGHVERFNPIYSFLQKYVKNPRFIEAHRLSPFPARSTDIGVVLDLMIHDIDVVLAFVNSEIESVDAVGIPVLSACEDIANVRIRFKSGCIANLTASRISPERMRKIRVFSGGETPCYVSLDYRAQEGFLYRLAREDETESSILKKLFTAKSGMIVSEFAGKRIVRQPVPIEKGEPLKLELLHFIQCVKARQSPVVSGESALRALELAIEITQRIKNNF